MALISRLGVILGLDTGQFSAGLGKAESQLNNFANKAKSASTTMTAVGAVVGAVAYKIIDYADALHDVAKANDISIASVIKLNQALTLNGGKAEDAGKILASFTNKVDEAAQGSDKMRAAFAEVGVSLNDLANMSMEDLFNKTAQALATMDDRTRANALSMDLFGKSVKTLDIKGFAEDLKTVQGISAQTEQGILSAAKSSDVLARTWGKLQASAAGGLGDTILWITEKFEKLVDWFVKADEAFRRFTGGLLGSKKVEASKFTPMSDEKVLPEILKSNQPARAIKESDSAKAAREKLQGQIEAQNKAYEQQLRTLQLQTNEIGKQQSTAAKLAIEFEKGGSFENLTKAQKEKLMLMAEQYDIAKKQKTIQDFIFESEKEYNQLKFQELQASQQLAASETIRMQQHQDEARFRIQDLEAAVQRQNLEKAMAGQADIIVDRALKLFDIQQRINQEKRRNGLLSETEMQQWREAEQALVQAEESNRRAQNTFQAGWDRAYNNFVEQSKDSAALGAQVFGSMTSNMTNAIDNFARTGKFSFIQMIASMIADLARLYAQAQATKFFSGLFDGFSLGSFFGGGDGVSANAGAYGINDNPFLNMGGGFANGGIPPVGVPSLVGERGPELFIPKTTGTIIPNNQLSNMMGGQPQTVINGNYIANVQAIDSKSFEDRLYQSSNAVWAANQYANKSLAVGRGRT